MNDLISQLTAYERQLCQDQASLSPDPNLTAAFQKYISQKKALKSAYSQLCQIRDHYIRVKQLKERAQQTLCSTLEAQLRQEISTETNIYRKFALFRLMKQPPQDLSSQLTAQLIATVKPRIKWKLQNDAAELQLICNDSLPFIHPELYLDCCVMQRLQQIVPTFGSHSLQVTETDEHSTRIERALALNPEAIEILQQFISRHFEVPCLLHLNEEEKEVRRAQTVLFAESTSLAVWQLHTLAESDPSTLAPCPQISHCYNLPLQPLQCLKSTLCEIHSLPSF